MTGARNRHADYHASKALGGSTAAKIGASCLRDALVPVEQGDAIRIGSCVDLRWLERMTGGEVYALPPDVNARTKEGKAQIAEWRAEVEREGLYTFDRNAVDCVARLERTVQALAGHRLAETMRRASKVQEAMTWTEEVGELFTLDCKGLIDMAPEHADGRDLFDLKTTWGEISPRAVRNLFYRRGYHFQLAHYRRGMRANGPDPVTCGLIVAQTNAPHGVEVFALDRDSLDAAEMELVHSIYPKYAAHLLGADPYAGHGELDSNGLEPVHTITL